MKELYPRIENYLDNALTDAERATFEANVQADPALAEALVQVREARERLNRQWAQESAESELRETLKSLGKQHFGSPQKASRIPLGRWWMAAAAAVVALVIWLAWPQGENALYKHYRKFPEAAFAMKSGEEQILEKAAKSFNTKNFNTALAGLNTYLEQKPGDSEARFFAGLCQLELSQLAEAETTFQQIISSKNAWSGEARWYLALTYLRGKKPEMCKEVLRQIPPESAYYIQAQGLLKKI